MVVNVGLQDEVLAMLRSLAAELRLEINYTQARGPRLLPVSLCHPPTSQLVRGRGRVSGTAALPCCTACLPTSNHRFC
jgi:hypothetical protein